MKKILTSEQLKNIWYILGYWLVFVVMPILVMFYLLFIARDNGNMSGWIALYIIFIAPFLYCVPYLLSKPKSKLLFIFWGLVVPYLFIYIHI
ncbi:MAG: hypothetical protein WC456_02200 [Patescibacteria group bacterium]